MCVFEFNYAGYQVAGQYADQLICVLCQNFDKVLLFHSFFSLTLFPFNSSNIFLP